MKRVLRAFRPKKQLNNGRRVGNEQGDCQRLLRMMNLEKEKHFTTTCFSLVFPTIVCVVVCSSINANVLLGLSCKIASLLADCFFPIFQFE